MIKFILHKKDSASFFLHPHLLNGDTSILCAVQCDRGAVNLFRFQKINDVAYWLGLLEIGRNIMHSMCLLRCFMGNVPKDMPFKE